MRTSLRDAADLTPKNIIVPDERLALYLAEMLPVAAMKKMDTGIADETNKGGRPRVHQNNAEKMRRRSGTEAEKRTALLAEVFIPTKAQDASGEGCSSSKTAMHRNETPIALYRGSVSQDQYFWASIFSHIKSTMPEGYLSCASLEHFALAMHTSHERQLDSKTTNALFSPAIFDPARSPTSNRGRDNILYLQNVVLDFENGELRPDQIPNIFPDLQLIVTNTHRHTNEEPRFRVIVLTSAPVDPTAYEALWDAIANKLRDAGYVKSRKSKATLKRSGLDYSKRTSTSLFYLPAQAANAADSFFNFYNDEGRQPLNPETWLRNVRLETAHEVDPLASPISTGGDRAALQAAIDKWRATSPGQGNEQFYTLATELRKCGMTADEIEQTLLQEASFGRSPAERRDQIPSIMHSLGRHGRAA